MAKRLEKPTTFTVTAHYELAGPAELEVRVTPTGLAIRALGGKWSRAMPWHEVDAALDGARVAAGMRRALFG